MEVNPTATAFLKETRIEKKNSKTDLTLWDHIQVRVRTIFVVPTKAYKNLNDLSCK